MTSLIFTPSKRLNNHQVFLVGGAVRDHLLGFPIKDHDYVVVGATPDQMLAAGFSQVGKDFPVFLDPDDKNEYALARIERKTGHGYQGFSVSCDGVSLEEDLGRRDLTINAMALSPEGRLVDPFGGQKDLQEKILRHVGPAFAEDPLRVLRVARFAARYAPLGFTVAKETMDLMRGIVDAGEIDHLVPERVWLEFTKAAQTSKPSVFLRVLKDCGALKKLLPEVDVLYGIPQNPEYHPEVDTGIHTEMVLDQAVALAPGQAHIAFAALTHDLGKGLTPKEQWPKHIDHEQLGLDPLNKLIQRWKVPNVAAELARLVCVHHLNVHRSLEIRTGTVLDLINKMDGLRQPQRFLDVLLVCEADKRGRLGWENKDYPQRQLLSQCLAAAKTVTAKDLAEQGLTGLEIKEKLTERHLRAIKGAQGVFRRSLKEKENLDSKSNTQKVSSKPERGLKLSIG